MRNVMISAAVSAAFFMAPMAVVAEEQIAAPLVLAKETKPSFAIEDFPWDLPEGRTENVTVPLGEAVLSMPWMDVQKDGDDHVVITAPEVTILQDTDDGSHKFVVVKEAEMLVRQVGDALVVSGDAGSVAIADRTRNGPQAVMEGAEFVFTTKGYDLAVEAIKADAKSGSKEVKTAMQALSIALDYSVQSTRVRSPNSDFGLTFSSGPSDSSIVFGDGRLGFSTEGVSTAFSVDAPFPVKGEIGSIAYEFSMPTEASKTTQPMQFGFEISDVSINDTVWDLVDPNQIFPREFDNAIVEATLDVILNESMFDDIERGPGAETLEPTGGRLTALEFDGLGLDVSANGDVEMDGDVPKDVSAFLSVAGLSEFMKNVVKAGFVPQSQAILAEGIALQFGKEEGDGSLSFDLKTENGMISINGNRVAPLPR